MEAYWARWQDNAIYLSQSHFPSVPGFADLIVWKEAASLAANVTEAARLVVGPSAQSVADQIVRAANSIPANIAEGYGRGVSRDGLRFFRMARSSADELESHLRVIGMSRRLAEDRVVALVDQTRRSGYLIYRFQASLERRIVRASAHP